MSIDLPAMYEVFDLDQVEIEYFDSRLLERYMKDLEQALDDRQIDYDDEEEFREYVESTNSEYGWLKDEIERLQQKVSDVEERYQTMTSNMESMLRVLYYRMTEEEKEQYNIESVKNKIRKSK